MSKITLAICLLLVGFSAPSHLNAAFLGGNRLIVPATMQDTEASVTVEGPTEASPGSLVVLSVEKSNAKSYKWIVKPSTDNYLVIEDGKKLVFSSGVTGSYTFIVAGALGDSVDIAMHTVTIRESQPTVNNPFKSKVAAWCGPIESKDKKTDCLVLSHSFSNVAKSIEEGKLDTAEEIVRATYESNKDALGEDGLDAWVPFRDGLSKELTKMAKADQLSDAEAHRKVWTLISQALREYASTL